ncbi:Alanine--tRNA ligase [Anaerolineae bacterium]|nr:Alanine--tRNA ligase [Anaerolineae bacterium]
MTTELGYFDDPLQLEFQATIVRKIALADGRAGIVLDKTWFYPTGGGQEHDTGTLGDARVSDVFFDDQGDVVHIVDHDIPAPIVVATIDRARRFAFMQHHSGQHLLSRAVEQVLGLETVSANINIDNPSTIDLSAHALSDADLVRAEDLANAIIYADRAIKSYFVEESQIHTIPFRRAPKVTGTVRVVEIDACDYSACGGTHCTRTGMIGVIKILRLERRGDKARIHFLAGERALKYFQNVHAIVTYAARVLDTNPDAIVETLTRQSESLRAAQKELEAHQADELILEAKRLVANAESFEAVKLVTIAFRHRAPQQVRALAIELQNEPGLIALLAAYDGAKVTLTVTCAADTRVNANELIRKQLAEIGGRGGGDARLAQGGGALSEEKFATFFANTKRYVSELLQ